MGYIPDIPDDGYDDEYDHDEYQSDESDGSDPDDLSLNESILDEDTVSLVEIETKEKGFQELMDHPEFDFRSNLYLANNPDVITEGLSYIDTDVDILITSSVGSSSVGTSSVGSSAIGSYLFEMYELYAKLKANSLPYDLGGPNIKLLFNKYMVTKDTKRFGTRTELGENGNYLNEVIKAIITKYQGSEKELKDLQNDILFLNKPKSLEIKKHDLPYRDGIRPSDIVFIDGLCDIPVVCDNLHLHLDNRGFMEEDYTYSREGVNFFCLYSDSRLGLDIWTDSVRVLLYNDIKTIAFDLFKTGAYAEAQEATLNKTKNLNTNSQKNPNYLRYLLYITPKSKLYDGNPTIQQLDDIIDTIPTKNLNGIAKEIRSMKIKTRIGINKILKTSSNGSVINVDKDTLHKSASEDNIYPNTDYNLEDILADGISINFVIVGLNENNIGFREKLLHRLLLRGSLATVDVYTYDQLPIEKIHTLYDAYIYTPTAIWDSPRFLPECYWFAKKILYTKMAKRENEINKALVIRISDVEKHLSLISEDDLFGFPKMQLSRNLLGYWLT